MEIKMDVYATANAFTEDEIRGKTIVVIDVLRTSSTILTALENGAKGIIPVLDSGEAGTIAQKLDATSYLLCGERDAGPIEGYDLGNSPGEYTKEVVHGKMLLLSTTNGTRAIRRCEYASKVIIAGFLNAKAVVDYLKKNEKEAVIVCSGWKNRLSIEDFLCAGYIISEVYEGKIPDSAADGVHAAYGLFKVYGKNIKKALAESNHGRRLAEMGFVSDILYCSTTDLMNRVPMVNEGIII